MNNLRISTKLFLVAAVSTVMAFLLCYTGYTGIDSTDESLTEVVTVRLPSLDGLYMIQNAQEAILRAERTLLIAELSTPKELERQEQHISDAYKSAQDGFKIYDSLSHTKEEETLRRQFLPLWDEWKSLQKQVVALIKEGKRQEAITLSTGKAREALNNSGKLIDDIIALNRKTAEESAKITMPLADKSKSQLILIAVICILLSNAVAFYISYSIARPVKRALQFSQAVADGDLSQRLSLRGRDEIAMLGNALDSMVETLWRLKSGITETAGLASSGYLRSTVDGSGFKGEYKHLAESINTWASNMLLLIDKVPSPIMIRDLDRNMRFLNAAGSLGKVDVSRLEGRKCDDHFKTGDCTNGNCACDRAFRSRAEERSFTMAKPLPGLELDIMYNAIPFGSDAVFEFVTDQSDIMKTQRKIVDIADKADQVSIQVASAAEELSAQIEQSSKGAEVQTHRVDETATAMEEMNATVMEVARAASHAAQTASQAHAKAADGSSVVDRVVRGIEEVQQQSQEMKADMAHLGKQAEGISQIMNVISDIADQTNLLALNAAIEAARAGDAGRGFAVVADEVRKLAEKTMTATKEVGDAIQGIQDGTRKNIGNVERSARTIEEATTLAMQSGESLKEIVTLVDSTSDQVRSIATASEQQSSASEEINRNIEDVSRISGETSDAMHQSALAVMEMSKQAQVLKNLISEMQSGNGSTKALTS